MAYRLLSINQFIDMWIEESMAIGFDKALGNFADNLKVYSQRAELLASNLANADTPGYKAKDIDFRTVLAKAGSDDNQVKLRTTNKAHSAGSGGAIGQAETLYRVPLQPSLDGNTVDAHVEQGQFTQNAMRFQSTLTFLNGRIKGLKMAIKGE